MAQSGYTPILIYASGTASAVPSASNLTSSASGAELALNYADGKLYFKNSSGTVTLLAGSGGGGPAAGSNTQIQFNNSGVFGASTNLTWDGTKVTSTGLSITGNTVLGDASADTVTVNGTITSNLIFTDNTYDIGASGATRPRNYYGSGDIFLGNIAAGRYVKTNAASGNVIVAGDATSSYAVGYLFSSGGASDTNLAGFYALGSGTTLDYLSIGGTSYNNGTMFIKNGASSKYVGINISAMSAALHVLGYGTYGDSTTDFIRISSSASGGTVTNPTSLGNIAWYDTGGSATVFARIVATQNNPAASTAATMQLQVNSSNLVTVSGSTGYVGINNETPNANLAVGSTIGYTNNTTKTAGVILGTQGTSGSSLFVNTPSLSASYGSGLAVWGTYGATKSAINLTASGVYSGGGYHSDFNLQTTSGTTATTRLSINGSNGNIVVGDASSTYQSAFSIIGQDSSTYTSFYVKASGAATQSLDITTARFLDGSGVNGVSDSSCMTFRSSGSSNGSISLASGNTSYYFMRTSGSSVFAQGSKGYGWAVNADSYGIDIGSRGGLATGGAGQPFLAYNNYYDGTDTRYKVGSVPASSFELDASGQFIWYRAAGGSAGASFTATAQMVLNTGGQLLLGATSSNGVFTLKNTNPATTLIAIQNYSSTGLIGGLTFDQATDIFTIFNNTNTSTSAINLSTNAAANAYLITKENLPARRSVGTQVGAYTYTYNYGCSGSASSSTLTVALGTWSGYDSTYGQALAKVKCVLVYATAGTNMSYAEIQATTRRSSSGTAWTTDSSTIYSHNSGGGAAGVPTLYWSNNVLYVDVPTYVGFTFEIDVSILSGTFAPSNYY